MDQAKSRGLFDMFNRQSQRTAASRDQTLITLPTARPPAISFLTIGGAVFVFWSAITTALRFGTSVADSVYLFGTWFLLNVTAFSLVLLILGAARKFIPDDAYRGKPALRGYALSYGGYFFAGLIAGVVRHVLAVLLGSEGLDFSLAYVASNVSAVVVSVLILGLAANAYYTFGERIIGQQKMLREQVRELEKSRYLITVAEENLRREIAELLHGRVQSRLVVAWHRLGQVEALMTTSASEAQALLAEVREEIDQIRERDVRQASHLLHPSIIQVGLVPAVRSLVERFTPNFKVALHVDPALVQLDNPADNRIPEPVRLAAYRVLEEALSNINRHANATRVDISVASGADERLGIVVVDNGDGFDTRDLKQGLGLNAIAARVSQSGGTWFISSTRGRGTRLSAFMPFRESLEEDVEEGGDQTESSVVAARFAEMYAPERRELAADSASVDGKQKLDRRQVVR